MEPFIFYTLKSSLCLSAGYFLYYLLLRRETFHRFNRFVLLGIILISIIVPVIKIVLKMIKHKYPGTKTRINPGQGGSRHCSRQTTGTITASAAGKKTC